MSVTMSKPWLAATPEELAEVPVTTGVYEIAADGVVVDIDYAGSRENFGLRSAIARAAIEHAGEHDVTFHYEQHVQYQSRYVELVLSHQAHHDGALPSAVRNRPIPVHGRMSSGSLKK